MKAKKAQLQMAAFNLIAIVLSILLVVYIGMSQNRISMDTVSANTEAQHLLLIRRLLGTPECLAYELRNYDVINNSGLLQIYSSRKVEPFVIDMGKFEDDRSFRCLGGIFGDQANPTQFRFYNVTITNIETGLVRNAHSTHAETYSLQGYHGVSTTGCSSQIFYDTLPVLLYQNGQFYVGLFSIESCIEGKIIFEEEFLI